MTHTNAQSQTSVASHIALHARRRPAHTAVIRNGTPITYAAFHQNLQATIATLSARPLAPGQTAAISHEDHYIHFLLTFACEALGLATAAFRPAEASENRALLAAADHVISDHPIKDSCKSYLAVTENWLAIALSTPVPQAGQRPPHLPIHPSQASVILRSSGATGAPKLVSLTHAQLRARCAHQRDPSAGFAITRQSRFLAMLPIFHASTHITATNIFRLGATFVFHTQSPHGLRRSAEQLLAAYNPTHIIITPLQLRNLLSSLPNRFTPLLPNLTIQSTGAHLSPGLATLTRQKLAGRITDIYETNETGPIGQIDESGLIHLCPGVKTEIVAPSGGPLPPSHPGIIRLRTPSMVNAYLSNPQATAEAFTQPPCPWFHPGDLAVITGSGHLKLTGRRHDLLTLNGQSLPAMELESKILAATFLQDIAIIHAPNHPHLTVCAVAAPRTDPQSLHPKIAKHLPTPFELRLVNNIPRTDGGQIKRAALVEALSPALTP